MNGSIERELARVIHEERLRQAAEAALFRKARAMQRAQRRERRAGLLRTLQEQVLRLMRLPRLADRLKG